MTVPGRAALIQFFKTDCVCWKEGQNAMNSCFKMIYFSSGDWSRATSAWAIWYVALTVCCKQPLHCFLSLSCEHSSNYFQLLAFSHLPFISFKPVHSAVPLLGGGACLTATIFQWDNWGHSSCREQVNSQSLFGMQPTRMKNMNIDQGKRIFFFPEMAVLGSGALSWK